MIAISLFLLLPIWSNGCTAFTLSPTRKSRPTNGPTNHFRMPDGRAGAASPSSLFESGNKEGETQQDTALTSTSTLSTSREAHALEVFERYSSDGEYEGQKFISKPESLLSVLENLDMDATQEDAEIVFRFLDSDGDGRLLFHDEFLPWYLNAVEQASEISRVFQSLLVGRRSVDEFDQTPVDDAILRRAVQCGMAAPNRSCSEPWRFLSVGPATVGKLAELNAEQTLADAEKGKFSKFTDWTSVAPGWCVVTTRYGADTDASDGHSMSSIEQEDFKAVCCAIQNFMLSMWSEGIGTKWTTGPVQKTPEFADLCGIDRSKERVVGTIWYGYATGGTKYADPRRRKLSVDDVLGYLP
mmetsp:Transcript_13073/g.27632  ORF Transcript_13073/g.27632 Transcript_13073/m.27632 type:complete len:356 (+) Transcript_13073:208-1275(+)